MTPEDRRAIEWECARLIQHYANLTNAHGWRFSERRGALSFRP